MTVTTVISDAHQLASGLTRTSPFSDQVHHPSCAGRGVGDWNLL